MLKTYLPAYAFKNALEETIQSLNTSNKYLKKHCDETSSRDVHELRV